MTWGRTWAATATSTSSLTMTRLDSAELAAHGWIALAVLRRLP